jgi:RNA polymerase-binding protein
MAERALRGTRLGATSYENDRNTDLAPRQDVPFDCPNGHHFSVPFAAEAELPPMWECRVCGSMATASTGDSPSPKKVKPPRSHWDMLMERRTVEDLEAVLAERLEVVRERRALEARAIADVAGRRSALSPAGGDPLHPRSWGLRVPHPPAVGTAQKTRRTHIVVLFEPGGSCQQAPPKPRRLCCGCS